MPVRLGICTRRESSIRALLTELGSIPGIQIKCIELPYNDLDRFRVTPGDVDGIILCHSIFDRRFAITDVTDALYNKFLLHVEDVVGKENTAVIAHDFKWPMDEEMEDHGQAKKRRLEEFDTQQPTTFQCASLVMMCGRLDSTTQMDSEDVEQLRRFVSHVRPANRKTLTPRLHRLGHSGNRTDHDGNHVHAILVALLEIVIFILASIWIILTAVTKWIIDLTRKN